MQMNEQQPIDETSGCFLVPQNLKWIFTERTFCNFLLVETGSQFIKIYIQYESLKHDLFLLPTFKEFWKILQINKRNAK